MARSSREKTPQGICSQPEHCPWCGKPITIHFQQVTYLPEGKVEYIPRLQKGRLPSFSRLARGLRDLNVALAARFQREE